jgi:hypothetical protein
MATNTSPGFRHEYAIAVVETAERGAVASVNASAPGRNRGGSVEGMAEEGATFRGAIVNVDGVLVDAPHSGPRG